MVDVGTVRFHDVVGEAVGVVAVVVVNAQRGQQPAGYESPGHDGAQNGVAVVEQVVGRYTVAFAPEVRYPGEGGAVEQLGWRFWPVRFVATVVSAREERPLFDRGIARFAWHCRTAEA